MRVTARASISISEGCRRCASFICYWGEVIFAQVLWLFAIITHPVCASISVLCALRGHKSHMVHDHVSDVMSITTIIIITIIRRKTTRLVWSWTQHGVLVNQVLRETRALSQCGSTCSVGITVLFRAEPK